MAQIMSRASKMTLHEYLQNAILAPPQYSKFLKPTTLPLNKDLLFGGWSSLQQVKILDQPSIEAQVESFLMKLKSPQYLALNQQELKMLHVGFPARKTTFETGLISYAELYSLPEDIVIPTLKTILHHIRPNSQDWSFQPLIVNPLMSGFCVSDPWVLAQWTENSERPPSMKIAVFVTTSWNMTDQDFIEFASCSAPQKYSLDSPYSAENWDKPAREKMVWGASESMWNAIHDACEPNGVTHFVFTSYERWVFGGFSKDYKTGYTSRIYQFDEQSPNVMQLLTFWMISSFNEGEGWQPPAGSGASVRIRDDKTTSIWTAIRNDPLAALTMYSCMAMLELDE